ncbi:putative non-specific serine/threonine protein kinase [Helianthus annuus]|nr:putative non-specific serine/threonine protein kinase [Helianthus annuus]
MEDHSTYLFFIVVFILLQTDCAALDTISANQVMKYGETIISSGKIFELVFFSPGNSKNQYLGIWYKKVSTGTVVWVANKETPITDNSGMFKVSINGNLVILSGGNTVVWSSNSTGSECSNNLAVVQLIDTGNLVVWCRDKKSTKQNLIWQSFDYPGDTLLPRMMFGKDLVSGKERSMTC